MRLIKFLLLAVILIGLVLMAVANNQLITLQLLPDPIAAALNLQPNPSFELPVYAWIIGAAALGMLLGYLIEYFRESKHRRRMARSEREMRKVSTELDEVRRKTGEGEDEVLKILKQAS